MCEYLWIYNYADNIIKYILLFYTLKLMQNKVDELKTEQSIHSQKNIK